MANTYHQLYIQTIFGVKCREALIDLDWEDKLHSIIGNLINQASGKSILINGTADHIHCFFHLKPSVNISDIMQKVKSNSSKWINDSKLTPHRFEWQKGFGCFSYGHSQKNQVYQYVKNQKEHHKKYTFREEYMMLLKKFEVDFDEAYIFSDPV
ncbi:MAG: transposase [Balneola sp.]|nr:transposase [Balneola sp.]|tara:strand:- start:5110 stop:5571 length:462 start_codon:yes stop_codon:yes gene_type:complete